MNPLLEPDALRLALVDVQRRYRRQRRQGALRLALAVAGGVVMLLGLWRALNLSALPPLSFPLALLVGVVAGLTVLCTPSVTRRQFTLLDAARLVDSHGQLCGLLTTAWTLPEALSASQRFESTGVQVWEAALHDRVRSQAREAARALRPPEVLPAPPALVWAGPAAALGLATVCWLVPPLSAGLPVTSPPPAEVVDDVASAAELPQAAVPMPEADATSLSAAAGPVPDTEPSGGFGLDVPRAPVSSAPDGPAISTRLPGAPATDLGSLADVRPGDTSGWGNGWHMGASGTQARTTTDASTRDTPFGVQEPGDFENQLAPPGGGVTGLPYNPPLPPGVAPLQQEAAPGSSGRRASSGGRGIESEGTDKCVEGCLTSNDMNRGAPRPPSTSKPPDGEAAGSGTSDSGSSVAGDSSVVGLGAGTLRPIGSRSRIELNATAGVSADRLQVLAVPSSARSTAIQATRAPSASGAEWINAPEAPGASGNVPEVARATVRAYFERRSP